MDDEVVVSRVHGRVGLLGRHRCACATSVLIGTGGVSICTTENVTSMTHVGDHAASTQTSLAFRPDDPFQHVPHIRFVAPTCQSMSDEHCRRIFWQVFVMRRGDIDCARSVRGERGVQEVVRVIAHMVPPSRTRMRVLSYSTLSTMLKLPTTQYMVCRCPLSKIRG